MAKQDIRIEGLDQILKQLDATPDQLLETLKPVVERHTKTAESKALSQVPVREGTLKASIASEVKTGPTWVFGRVAASDPKAHLLEYGTVKAPAQPFMRPGYEAGRSGFESDAKAAVENLK